MDEKIIKLEEKIKKLENKLEIANTAIGLAFKKFDPDLKYLSIHGAVCMIAVHNLKCEAKQYLEDLYNHRRNKYIPTMNERCTIKGDDNG